MAGGTNRYTKLSFGNLNDLPLLSLPYEQLNAALTSAQTSKDQFTQASALMPRYIQESPSDLALANNIKQYQASITDELAQAASTGDVQKYRQKLSQAKNSLVDLWKPGGAAAALETRYQQDLDRKKKTQEFFKDNPRLVEPALKRTGYNDINYQADQRVYSNLNEVSNIYRDIKDEDVAKWFDQNLGNIKDTLLSKGGLSDVEKKQLDGITSVYDFYKLKGRTFNNLVETLYTTFPEEFKQSINQKYEADRYYNPNLPEMSNSIFNLDDDKNIKMNKSGEYDLNVKNPIGKLIYGYAKMGERIEREDHYIKDDNEIALENLKHKNRKKEIDYENAIQYSTLTSRVFGNTSGMGEMKLDIDDKGQIKSGNTLANVSVTPVPGGSNISTAKGKPIGTGKNAIELIKSGKMEQQYPGVSQIYNKFANEIKDLTPKQQVSYIQEKYNELSKEMNWADISWQIPTGKNAKQKIDLNNNYIIGKDGRLGAIGQMTVYAYDQAKGIQGKNMSMEQILSTYNLTPEEFTKQAGWLGESMSNNPKHPSGQLIQLTDKKGKVIQLLATPESQEMEAIKLPAYKAASPLYNTSETSEPFNTGIKEYDDIAPSGFITRRETKYATDVIDDRVKQLQFETIRTKEPARRQEINIEVSNLMNQRKAIARDPKNNKLQEIQLGLYDAATGEKLGGQPEVDAIIKQIEAKGNLYKQQ